MVLRRLPERTSANVTFEYGYGLLTISFSATVKGELTKSSNHIDARIQISACFLKLAPGMNEGPRFKKCRMSSTFSARRTRILAAAATRTKRTEGV